MNNFNARLGLFERFGERIESPGEAAVLLGIDCPGRRRIGPGKGVPRGFDWRPCALGGNLVHGAGA